MGGLAYWRLAAGLDAGMAESSTCILSYLCHLHSLVADVNTNDVIIMGQHLDLPTIERLVASFIVLEAYFS